MTTPTTGSARATSPGTTGAFPTADTTRGLLGAGETKPAFKTTEMGFYILAVIGVLIATAVVKGFTAAQGWFYVTLLTVGYMLSRGLAKAGSCQHRTGNSTIDLR
jgi:hypothetical protein